VLCPSAQVCAACYTAIYPKNCVSPFASLHASQVVIDLQLFPFSLCPNFSNLGQTTLEDEAVVLLGLTIVRIKVCRSLCCSALVWGSSAKPKPQKVGKVDSAPSILMPFFQPVLD